MTDLVVGIDASRNRSGGARAHLVGLLTGADPKRFGIRTVHVWAYESLIASVPDKPWIVKHSPPELARSLRFQVRWQYFDLPRIARELEIDIMFNTDAGTVCPFQPAVTLSQDMLSFEPGEMSRFGFSKAWIRLLLLRFIQIRSLSNARGAIFLTNYARSVIQKATGHLSGAVVIPHGIGEEFQEIAQPMTHAQGFGSPVRCLYVSNASMYKHPWNVVRAIAQVRKAGLMASLTLIGGGKGRAQRLLDDEIERSDPDRLFVRQLPFLSHDEIPDALAEADIFIFASSCENLPITLLEAMAAGLPIACSDRGPMREVLQDGGAFFDPEDPPSIARAILELIERPELRRQVATRAKALSRAYSWERCASETWAYLAHCARNSLSIA